jgi:multiple antibiotic resistance protein
MVQTFLTSLIPLVIIMDPVGNLPFFLLFTENHPPSERRRMAALASFTACTILIFFGLTGDWILKYFGVSLPAFQLAGGFVFFLYSLQMLHLIPSGLKTSLEEEQEGVERENVALVPLATPLLAGPGAITTVISWRQTAEDPLSIPLLIGAVTAACGLVFLTFLFGQQISRFLGMRGIRLITRLMGLLLAVIAVQFMVDGLRQIL